MNLHPNIIGAIIIAVIITLIFRLGRANIAAKEVEKARSRMEKVEGRVSSKSDLDITDN